MDVRSAPMPTATAGPSRPHHEPRFSWVERPALPPITTFATRGLMKRNNGDSHHPFNPRADRVRFLIFSRQRSASNTLLNELRRHPNVTCHYEVLNIAQMPPEIGRGLNATYFTAVADLPRFMAQFWDFCPAQACGFKLFDKQMGRPLRELLQAAPPRSVRIISLERQNVTAEYDSWRRALSSGNWGVTPKRQDAAAFAKRQTTQCVRHPETCFARPEVANAMNFSEFEKAHRRWFAQVRALRPLAPVLHLSMEQLVASKHSMNATLARVVAFLGLRPLWTGPRGKYASLRPESDRSHLNS